MEARMRFTIRISGLAGSYKIWDTKLECFFRNNGKELEYKTIGKAKNRLRICNKNWPC